MSYLLPKFLKKLNFLSLYKFAEHTRKRYTNNVGQKGRVHTVNCTRKGVLSADVSAMGLR